MHKQKFFLLSAESARGNKYIQFAHWYNPQNDPMTQEHVILRAIKDSTGKWTFEQLVFDQTPEKRGVYEYRPTPLVETPEMREWCDGQV